MRKVCTGSRPEGSDSATQEARSGLSIAFLLAFLFGFLFLPFPCASKYSKLSLTRLDLPILLCGVAVVRLSLKAEHHDVHEGKVQIESKATGGL